MSARRLAAAALAAAAVLGSCGGLPQTSSPAAVSPTTAPAAASRTPAPSPSASTASPSVVPWLDAAPGPPAPPSVPPGTPACTAGDVSVEAGWQGGGGQMLGSVWVTNIGAGACALAGPPRRVELRDGDVALGGVAFAPDPAGGAGDLAAAPPVLLAPGGRAFSELDWSNLCTVGPRPVVTAVRVTLPDGSGPVDAARMDPGFSGLPRCDVPGKGSTLTAFAFQPEQPAAPAAQAPVAVAVAAPAAAQAGADLDYTVTLTNTGQQPAALDPCPVYDEAVLAGGARLKASDRRLVLNCAGVDGSLAAGATVTLAMRVPVPADAPAGPAQVVWALEPDGPLAQIPATAYADFAIASGTSPSAGASPAAGAAACAEGQLEVASVGQGGGLGTVSAWLMFTNAGARPCSLRGWPSLAGVLPDGRVTAARRSDVPVANPGAVLPPVELAPGDSAYAEFEGSDNPGGGAASCASYRSLRVVPPGGARPVLLSAWNAWLGADLPACAGIEVTEVVSAAYASALGNGPTGDLPAPAVTAVDPVVTVAPSTGLRAGQTVEVRVTGFGVGGKVFLSECATAASASDLGCGAQLAAQPFLVTDDGRSGSGTFTVAARATTGPGYGDALVPCADRCVLVATLGVGFPFAVAPIAFGP